jgi:GDPmannose 4,6-dehydratase
MRSALITGILGQDGQFLADLLIKKDYKVFGIINGQSQENSVRLLQDFPQIDLISGDLTDIKSLIRAI